MALDLTVPGDYVFAAGQYLFIHIRDRPDPGLDPELDPQLDSPLHTDAALPLSIASAPATLPKLELHYRSTPGDDLAASFDARLAKLAAATDATLSISDAQGDVLAPSAAEDLLVVAGGTGISQALSCATHRASTGGHTTVLWCADSLAEIYATDRFETLPSVDLVVRVDDRRTAENEGLAWLREQSDKFMDTHTILSGSPPFVYAATDVLASLGARRLYSDVYAYAPRE